MKDLHEIFQLMNAFYFTESTIHTGMELKGKLSVFLITGVTQAFLGLSGKTPFCKEILNKCSTVVNTSSVANTCFNDV